MKLSRLKLQAGGELDFSASVLYLAFISLILSAYLQCLISKRVLGAFKRLCVLLSELFSVPGSWSLAGQVT